MQVNQHVYVAFLDCALVIYHVEQGLCVGVVTPLQYCHYTSSRQPGQFNSVVHVLLTPGHYFVEVERFKMVSSVLRTFL